MDGRPRARPRWQNGWCSATGYRPDRSWLDVAVFDRTGNIGHDGGVVTDAPGMHLLGTSRSRRRRSSCISGAEADTDDLGSHLHGHLDRACGRRFR